MRPIVFLDFDGVLNSEQYYVYEHRPGSLFAGRERPTKDFCPMAVSNLLRILEDVPELRFVVSSSWRLGETLETVREILSKAGLDPELVIDLTPVRRHDIRGVEIKAWIDAHPEEKGPFLILDDDEDMGELMHFLYHTSSLNGLTYTDALFISNHLRQKMRELDDGNHSRLGLQ